jgi:DNA-directed RNA polymerase specialized sigma24 family protein
MNEKEIRPPGGSMTGDEQRALYDRLLRGDQQAWGYIHRMVQALCRRYWWEYRGGREDIAQEVMVHVISNIRHELLQQRPECCLAFIRQLAKWRIFDGLRDDHKRHLHEVSLAPSPNEETEDPMDKFAGPLQTDSRLEEIQAWAFLQEIMSDFSEECREAIEGYIRVKLGYIHNIKELALILGLPETTLRPRLRRCLQSLHAHPKFREWAKKYDEDNHELQ